MDKDFQAVILGACRTPIGAFGGAFKEMSAVDLGAIAIREAVARSGDPHGPTLTGVASGVQSRYGT